MKATLDYFDRVDKFIDKNPEVCRDCPFCKVERQRHEYWGGSMWEEFLNCDVLEGVEAECPQLGDDDE